MGTITTLAIYFVLFVAYVMGQGVTHLLGMGQKESFAAARPASLPTSRPASRPTTLPASLPSSRPSTQPSSRPVLKAWGEKCDEDTDCASGRCWTNEWTNPVHDMCVGKKGSLSEGATCLMTFEIMSPQECGKGLVCHDDKCVKVADANKDPICLVLLRVWVNEFACIKTTRYSEE